MCECSDKGCKVHKGESACDGVGTVTLYRIDTQDITGTLFCEECSNEAMDSGLFTDLESDHDYAFCPACDGEGVELGALGRLQYFRCRNCGMTFQGN